MKAEDIIGLGLAYLGIILLTYCFTVQPAWWDEIICTTKTFITGWCT